MPLEGRTGLAGVADLTHPVLGGNSLLFMSLVGGVFRLDLLAADAGDGVVRRNRGLAHADRDQRDLALVPGGVAGRVDPRQARLAGLGVDLDLPLALELQPPLGDRAEVRVEAEQRDQRLARHLLDLAGRGVLDRDSLDASVAVDLANLAGRHDPYATLALERLRLVHRGLQCPEAVAAVDERDRRLGGVLEPERPVERRVAAANDDAGPVAEHVLLTHEVVDAAALPVLDALDPEPARLEGAVAAGPAGPPPRIAMSTTSCSVIRLEC